MSKRRSAGKRTGQTPKSRAAGSDSWNVKHRETAAQVKPTAKHVPSPAAIRETIESVVVAFVLAFLFRTFEAEAFVIPTGSMAPTLMGRHKDLECPMCGYQYQASASDEVDSTTNVAKGSDWEVVGCRCPMCRYPMDLTAEVAAGLSGELTEAIRDILAEELDLPGDAATELAEKLKTTPAAEVPDKLIDELDLSFGAADELAEKLVEETQDIIEKGIMKKYPSFKGDRILVGKFCYHFSDPERWDVAVFKYPGEAKTNFIKRLVGLPGETIRIHHGDIFVKRDDRGFEIARKDRSEKLLAMLQPVYDNDYVLPEIIEAGWPARWQAWPSAHGSGEGAWRTSKDYRTFRTAGRAGGESWFRYQHILPSAYQWQYLKEGQMAPDELPERQLISDFSAYNTSRVAGKAPDLDSAGLHWVGDLAVQCTLEVLSDSGRAVFELVEGGWRMQCRIDVSTGKAALVIDHESPQKQAQTIEGEAYGPTAQTAVRGQGTYEIMFANCDDQLRLWVDGKVVEFDTTTCYKPLDNSRPHHDSFASDFSPVGIGSQGAALRVSHLKLLRDIYYIAEKYSRFSTNGILTDFERLQFPHRVLYDQNLWYAFDNMRMVEFPLEEDQFLALGDNSSKSKDGRLWQREGFEHYVKRDLLIGKALYIYWPHSWNKPFFMFPNFAKMGFVR